MNEKQIPLFPDNVNGDNHSRDPTVNVNWLQLYLAESVHKKLCTKIYCTTCGAMKFRLGVLKALAEATGRRPSQNFDVESAVGIAKALAEIQLSEDDKSLLEPATRCILFDICSSIVMRINTWPILKGSWAGTVLHSMEEHHRVRQSERRAFEEYQDPANVQKRRDEKKRLKQERHQQRLALQKERNRIWHETHGTKPRY